MDYESTRGQAPKLRFADVLIAGLAPDGGLYLPTEWPQLPDLAALRDASYVEVAQAVMWPFVEGEIDRATFDEIVADSYSEFHHDDICPVTHIGATQSGAPLHMLELFHGPTLAFKDVALQLVGRLFDHVLTARNERVCILGATSGDTGSAAIEACKNRDAIDIFILFPDGRVSEVQRRQMTTVGAQNSHAIAVADATFDDCQDLVKAAFGDAAFRDEVQLSAVNSINWARVMAQVVYYVYAALQVTEGDSKVSFVVPTGNFGNIFAGWVAKQMGLPVDRLVVASNRNDILTRFFESGTMEMHDVVPTTSPSMDIQISSNFERLLFVAVGRDGSTITELMESFRADGTVSVSTEVLDKLRAEFDAGRADDEAAAETIRYLHNELDILCDPHTAVGVNVALRHDGNPLVPVVSLATAHAAKFPDAVEQAIGVRPDLPEHLSDLLTRVEQIERTPNDLEAVQTHIRKELG